MQTALSPPYCASDAGAAKPELTHDYRSQDDREAGDEDSATEVAEILLRLQDNLHVNPRSRRYTTRNATGMILPAGSFDLAESSPKKSRCVVVFKVSCSVGFLMFHDCMTLGGRDPDVTFA